MTSGQCLCGAVAYVVDGPLRDVVNCHCERCRRTSGHHMAAAAATFSGTQLLRSESLRWYEAAPGVSYGFCSVCGSSLFWKADAHPDHLSICAGTLDGPTGLTTTHAWYVSEAGDYHERQPGLVEYETEPGP